MTFHDLHYNSMTFQVFHDLYPALFGISRELRKNTDHALNNPSKETPKTGKNKQIFKQADGQTRHTVRHPDTQTPRQTDRQRDIDKVVPKNQRTDKGMHAGEI